MKRRIALLAVLLVILVLVGTEVISVAEANPFGFAKQMDAPSDAKPPIISISSPQNNTDYSDAFNISFSVQEPQYFKSTVVANIWYTLDNTTVSIPYEYWTVTQGVGASQYSISTIAPTLNAGNHTLKIRAEGGSYDFHNYFLINAYSQVYFTVSDNNTQNTQTPTQGAGLNNKADLSIISILGIITFMVILAVAIVLLIYFKRRRGKP
jgi:hypothetical protein